MPIHPQRTTATAGAMALALVAVLTLPGSAANAANPIVTDRFVADPSAHVFNNRVYVYATHDQANSGTYWDSRDWRVYSSTDLVSWSDHGQVFAISGGFSWASQYAWAPTAAQRNGYYYLYLPVDRTRIGVARSTSPTSGFSDPRGTPLIDNARDANAGNEPIDPAVFTDDDGQAYLYFGSRTPKVVRLNQDMVSTSGAIQSLSVSGGNYAEAPWVHKRNGVYYLSYSTGWPGQIAYATAGSPTGPFTYRGIVLDYVNVNTNHQAIFEYNNQWYIAYHRNGLPGGGNFRRSLAMDHLYHNADGTIRPVVMTSTGVGGGTGGGYETLRVRHSGKLADVSGRSTADGAAVVQWATNGGTNQQWQIRDAGGGYSSVVNRNSGRCLRVSGGSLADGAPVVQWACGSGSDQQWQVRDAGGGYVQLVARHSGRCLDVNTGSTADGAALIQWPCTTGANQQWQRAAA